MARNRANRVSCNYLRSGLYLKILNTSIEHRLTQKDYLSGFYQVQDWTLDVQGYRLIDSEGAVTSLPDLTYKLLMALIEADGQVVSNDDIMQSVWGKQVVTGENLQQRIKLLRKTLATAKSTQDYIGTVRGKGYRLIPKPVWMKELPNRVTESTTNTSESTVNEIASGEHAASTATADSKGNQQKKHDESATIQFNAKAFWLGLALIVTFVLLLNMLNNGNSSGEQLSRVNRIAVIPFQSDEVLLGNHYIAAGLTEQLIHQLAQYKHLQVIARTSVIAAQKQNSTIRKLAGSLDATHVIETNIIFEEDNYQLSLTLIHGQKEHALWSQQLSASSIELNAIPYVLAQSVAQYLMPDVELIKTPQIANADAYDLYLKGRSHYLKYTQKDNQLASELFQLAIDKDPNFALAYTGLADAKAQGVHQFGLEFSEGFNALEYAERAIALQPDLAEAYKAKGLALDIVEKDQAALEAYEKAIALNHSYADAYINSAVIYWESGAFLQAVKFAQKASLFDPLEPYTRIILGKIYASCQMEEKATAEFQTVLRHQPNNVMAQLAWAQYLFEHQRYEASIKQAKKLLALEPNYTPALELLAENLYYQGDIAQAQVLYQQISMGQQEAANHAAIRLAIITQDMSAIGEWIEIVQEHLELDNANPDWLIYLAILQAHVDQDKSIAALDRAIQTGWSNIFYLQHEPAFKQLEETEGYQKLIRRLQTKLDQVRSQLAEQAI